MSTATPETTPETTPTTTPEPSRWDLLELDVLPGEAAPLPMWAVTVIAAIGAIIPLPADVAFEALRALVAPLVARPECPGKAAVRVAKDAKLAEIRAAERATAPVAAPTARQSIPTVTTPAPVAVAPVVTATAPGPVIGSYTKIQTGPQRGEWGARFAGCRAPVVGDVALVQRRSGGTQAKRVTAIVWSGTGQDGRAAHVVAIEDARDERVTLTYGAALALVSTPTPAADLAIEPAALNSELATEDLGLAQDLAAIQGESATNAATRSTRETAGAAYNPIAGFNTGEGYAQAARVAVTRATRDHYVTMARSMGVEIDESTLPALPTMDRPVGVGVTHTPAGPSIFDLPRSQRTFRVGAPTTTAGRQTMREAQTAIRDTLKSGGMIAGLMTERALLQWSWVGGGERRRDAFIAAFEAAGLSADIVPPAPSAERSCGHAVEVLKGRDYDTKRLSNAGLPDGVKARWQVGRALTGGAVVAGASYGEILLVVDLHADGDLTFDGDAGLASTVRQRYNAITGGEILKSDVLTAWLGRTLKRRFYAVKDGAAWYVPAGLREAARLLCDTIAPLWGSHRAINVTDERDVASVLGDSLRAELASVASDVTKAVQAAQDRATDKAAKDGTNPELAAKRATLTTSTAATLIKAVATVAARVTGYEATMGDEAARGLRQDLIAVQRALEAVSGDGTTARYAMLELD